MGTPLRLASMELPGGNSLSHRSFNLSQIRD
jgi:hypothetical protein